MYFLLFSCFVTGFLLAKCLDTSSNVLKFYTKNKGRTWWWSGKEMRASKLTDQLQDFNSNRYSNETGMNEGVFYDD